MPKMKSKKRKRNPMRFDPTRTLTIRRAFSAKLKKQFAQLKGRILRLVVHEDAFGLKERKPLPALNYHPHQMRSETGSFGPGVGVGVDREQMPQIKDLDWFLDWADGRGIAIDPSEVKAGDLKPVQSEYRQERVDAMDDDIDKPLLISKDDRVLDGTHRWIKAWQDDKDNLLSVLKIDLPMQEALRLMRSFPGVKHVENRAYPDFTLIEVPDVRQRDHFSCGSAAALSVAKYYGIGPDTLERMKHRLGTDIHKSTSPAAIVSFFQEAGCQVEARDNLSLADLQAYHAKGWPVIAPVQDYGPFVPKEARWPYGHYLTVIGATNDYVFCQDSSGDNVVAGDDQSSLSKTGSIQKPGRIIVDAKLWDRMWHDRDEQDNPYIRYGIAVGPPAVVNAFNPSQERDEHGRWGGGVPFRIPYETNIREVSDKVLKGAGERIDMKDDPLEKAVLRQKAADQMEKSVSGRSAAIIQGFRDEVGHDKLKEIREYRDLSNAHKELKSAAWIAGHELRTPRESEAAAHLKEKMQDFQAKVLGLTQTVRAKGLTANTLSEVERESAWGWHGWVVMVRDRPVPVINEWDEALHSRDERGRWTVGTKLRLSQGDFTITGIKDQPGRERTFKLSHPTLGTWFRSHSELQGVQSTGSLGLSAVSAIAPVESEPKLSSVVSDQPPTVKPPPTPEPVSRPSTVPVGPKQSNSRVKLLGDVKNRLEESLAGAVHLTEENKKLYRDTAHSLFDSMTDAGLGRFHEGVRRYEFFNNLNDLTQHCRATVRTSTLSSPSSKIAGMFTEHTGTLSLNGSGRSKENDIRSVYAHEFGHGVDGRYGYATMFPAGKDPADSRISGTKEWKAAWKEEIVKKGGISDYAKTLPDEGFAEFHRALVGGEMSKEHLRLSHPKCYALFEKHGLVS